METKVCSKCKIEKEVCDFYSHKTNSLQCKQCQCEYRKEWRRLHPGYDTHQCKKWANSNPEKIKGYYKSKSWAKLAIQLAKKRAKRHDLNFNLDEEFLNKIYPADNLCPLLKIPLFRGEKNSCPNSPTLDRIDSSKGYTKDNVQVISLKANTAKSNLSLDEMKLLVYNWELLHNSATILDS